METHTIQALAKEKYPFLMQHDTESHLSLNGVIEKQQSAFIEGSKLAIDTEPLVSALDKIINGASPFNEAEMISWINTAREIAREALNNVQVVQPAKTDGWEHTKAIFDFIDGFKPDKELKHTLAVLMTADMCRLGIDITDEQQQDYQDEHVEDVIDEVLDNLLSKIPVIPHPDSVKGTPVSELICKKCSNGLVNEPRKPEKHDCAYCGGTGVNIDLMEEILKKHSIAFDEKGLLYDQPPLRIGELAVAIKDLIVTNPHTDKQEGMRWLEELADIRNKLYEAIPTGEVKAFDLITLIKWHINDLDNLCSKLTYATTKSESGADNGREAKAICSHCGDEIDNPLCRSCEIQLTLPDNEY